MASTNMLVRSLQMNVPGGFKPEDLKFKVNEMKVTVEAHNLESKKKFSGTFDMEVAYSTFV